MAIKVAIASHVVIINNKSIHGPADLFSEFLCTKGVEHVFVKHSLEGELRTEIVRYDKTFARVCTLRIRLPQIIKWIVEVIFSGFFFLKNKRRVAIFVGVDPLNALLGVMLKHIGFSKISIYYTADFSPRRFNSPVLNAFYIALDGFLVKSSDYVWNVSSRIYKLRVAQGVPPHKNVFVPNAPRFKSVKRLPLGQVKRSRIVMIHNFDRFNEFQMVLEAIKDVATKIPSVELDLLGHVADVDKAKELIASMGLVRNVSILGLVSHNRLMQQLPTYNIGLALYSGRPHAAVRTRGGNWFGDSMKTREYLACGCPVITTNVPSTSDDVKKFAAGLVINFNRNELGDAILKLLMDDKFYRMCRENAIRLAKDVDVEIVYEEALRRIGVVYYRANLRQRPTLTGE